LTARWMAVVTVGHKGDAHRLLGAGFRGFLVKPVPGDVLTDVARRVIAQPMDQTSEMITRHSLKESEAADNDGDPARHARILVVEDNRVNQKVLQHFLSQKGCSVDTAANGLEAVQLSGQIPYDLIFMDCRMPEMDGLEATRVIRDRERQRAEKATPIVGLTAHALSHSHLECLSVGMNGYLTKPFKRDLLWQEVIRWISKVDPI
jgi:two-component system, sensor histidine kinase and response regulator